MPRREGEDLPAGPADQGVCEGGDAYLGQVLVKRAVTIGASVT
jgi:hypothetical protein